MGDIAGKALSTAALFLIVVAILVNSSALFYMATAMSATIVACRLQSYLSVRALRFERVAPENVKVGDLVTVEITAWSERKIRRPLITILDNLPARLLRTELTPSLPIAPAYDMPIRTQYQFRALKRGHYAWSGLTVVGTDALGVISMRRKYETTPTTMTVLPAPIPVSIELPSAAGWGLSEAESGQSRGAGMEPRGVREYATGDSLRYVHWRSSARAGQLLVKEFEAGSHAAAAFVIQRTKGSEIGQGASTTLELMCGHAAFLSDLLLMKGSRVLFPVQEDKPGPSSAHERQQEILELLAGIQAEAPQAISADLDVSARHLPPGSVLFAFMAIQDDALPRTAMELGGRGAQTVVLAYDAYAFVPKAAAGRLRSAADPEYLERLRAAGAFPICMPTEALA